MDVHPDTNFLYCTSRDNKDCGMDTTQITCKLSTFACVRWQVTLGDPIWQAMSHSCEMVIINGYRGPFLTFNLPLVEIRCAHSLWGSWSAPPCFCHLSSTQLNILFAYKKSTLMWHMFIVWCHRAPITASQPCIDLIPEKCQNISVLLLLMS